MPVFYDWVRAGKRWELQTSKRPRYRDHWDHWDHSRREVDPSTSSTSPQKALTKLNGGKPNIQRRCSRLGLLIVPSLGPCSGLVSVKIEEKADVGEV